MKAAFFLVVITILGMALYDQLSRNLVFQELEVQSKAFLGQRICQQKVKKN